MLISALRDVAVRLYRNKQIRDSNLFQTFHHRYSTALILACFVVLVFNQSFDSHIYCISGKSSLSNIIDKYCYWLSTFILLKSDERSIYYGVGTHTNKTEVKMVAYYQWVQLFLIMHYICFYLGRSYWKTTEKNRLSKFIDNFNQELSNFKSSEDEILNNYIERSGTVTQNDVSEDLRKLLVTTNKKIKPFIFLALNRDRGVNFVIVELINLIMLLVLISITDIFLQGEFINLGYQWATNRHKDLLDSIFPKMTKCNFKNYGPSGTVEKSDAMCFLQQNILNEKIFVLLWFWYIALIIITTIGLIIHMIQYFIFRNLKYHRLIKNITNSNVDKDKIINALTYSDFIYLTHLLDSIEYHKFNIFIKLLSLDLNEETKANPLISIMTEDINVSTNRKNSNSCNNSLYSEAP